MLAKHYSPRARLLLFTGHSDRALARLRDLASALAGQGYRLGVMATAEDAAHFADLNVEIAELGSESDLPQIGRSLFAQMRRLDNLRVDVILVRAPAQEGLGLTIWDRLFRAAEGKVFNLDSGVDVGGIVQALEHRKSG
jgi:L-threonylcarbamoyladenylate synthase